MGSALGTPCPKLLTKGAPGWPGCRPQLPPSRPTPTPGQPQFCSWRWKTQRETARPEASSARWGREARAGAAAPPRRGAAPSPSSPPAKPRGGCRDHHPELTECGARGRDSGPRTAPRPAMCGPQRTAWSRGPAGSSRRPSGLRRPAHGARALAAAGHQAACQPDPGVFCQLLSGPTTRLCSWPGAHVQTRP